MAVRFKWEGEHVIVETIHGNYCGRVMYAKNAYMEGMNVIVISSTGQQVVFSPNGTRSTR